MSDNEYVQKIRELAKTVPASELAKQFGFKGTSIYHFGKKHNIKFINGKKHYHQKTRSMFPCEICGTLFHTKKHQYEGRIRRTCSQKCSNKLKSQNYANSNRVTLTCNFCDKSYTIKASRATSSNYCSRTCATEGKRIFNKDPEKFKLMKEMSQSGSSNVEIAKALGYGSETGVAQMLLKYNVYKKYGKNKSRQEATVIQLLSSILNETPEGPGKYPDSNYLYDANFKDFYLEYDGVGGHYRPDQIARDMNKKALTLDKPIKHLSPQAYHGGEAYLRLQFLNEKTGYCLGKNYTVKFISSGTEKTVARELTRDCHPLGDCPALVVFGLFFEQQLIGIAKWGIPTNRYDTNCIELRRFFVLDGTPKNTESWFLNKTFAGLKLLGHKKLITYCHEWESGSYLLATGWNEIEREHQNYDYYLWNGKVFSKRVWWKWAKESGLVSEFGTTTAKQVLAEYLGAKVIYEGTKKKFVKEI